MKELCINESLEENRQMTKKQLKKDLKIKDKWSCIKLSVRKTKKQGKGNKILGIQMDEYLLTIEHK